MQFPESWLREFCNPPLSSQQLADLLTMSGMEVEELRPVAPPFANIVVAEIVEAEPHPNADKLRVCRVDAGKHSKDGPLQIVCGAPNARVGIRVPLALVGAELPPGEDGKPFKIGVGKLRGVESFGMLCSARELKLSDDHGGLLELASDAPLGEDVRKTLALDDHLLTLKLTPNLGHCLSVYGIAREVSALTGAPLTTPTFPPVKTSHDDILPVLVEAKDLCGRFSGRIVRGVNPKAKTPAWMVDRLARCGQRSVTALVDISNYVMFEYGRPSHIFDLDKIDRELVVRWGKKGESLKLLNGNTVELDDQVGVIADAKAVESLAGIMGGDHTAVSDDTKNVYVEAAFWWPEAVMGRSRRYAFATDAGHRFERGVDPVGTVEHIERITQLILDSCGGQAGPIDDQQPAMPQRQPVTLRHNLARRALRVRIFEAGRVYLRNPAATDGEVSVAGLDQPMRIAALAYGPADALQWAAPERAVDFFDVKGDIEALLSPLQPRFGAAEHPALHPGRSAQVALHGRPIGWVGELHPRWVQGYELPSGHGAPVLFELDLGALLDRPLPAVVPLPRQQPVLRDLALVLGEAVSHDALISALKDDASGLVRSVELFDVYKPKGAQGGERSMAVRLELRDDETTLTDERIEAVMQQAVERATSRLGARLRG
jgi:phenylalanyl-tRNA synthetase beta subunit